MVDATVLSIQVAVSAMAKVLIVFILGFLAARYPRPGGMLPQNFTSQMSVLLFNMLSPFLLTANLSRNVSLDKLTELWPLVFWAYVHIILGYLLGKCIVFVFRPRKEYHSSIVCVLGYTNSVSLPLIMMDSIARSEFFKGFEGAYEKASGFFFMYSVAWNTAFYSFGYSYLAGSSLGTIKTCEGEFDDPRPPTFRQRAAFTWKMIYTNPNMVAMLIAFIIGLVPFLKYQLFTEGTFFRPVMQAVQLLGGGAVPLGSLVMAANVAMSVKRNFSSEGRSTEPEKGYLIEWFDPFGDGCSYTSGLPSLATSPTEILQAASHPMGAHHVISLDLENKGHHSNPIQSVASYPTFHSNQQATSTVAVVEDDESVGDYDPNNDDPVGYEYPTSLSYVASNDDSECDTGIERRGNGKFGNNTRAKLLHGSSTKSDDTDPNSIELAPLPGRPINTPAHGISRNGTSLERVFSVDNEELSPQDREKGLKMSHSGRFYYQNIEIFPPKFDGSDEKDSESLPPPKFPEQEIVSVNEFRARLRPRLREVELPAPILPPMISAAIVISKLILLPAICFGTFFFVDHLGFSAFVPEDKIFRISMLLLFLTPSAESILVILSKQNLVRQAMAISLIYVYQFVTAIFTIAIGVTLSILFVF